MPTTSNFGWTTPADTDLVKDGAAAIRTLGNGIDTSLVDLKGGTTGQVLSKNSNTDLDFTWVAQDDSNAIQNALLTTTGDTIYASGASTPARLGIGTTGQVLTVSGGVPTWATPASGGAGNMAQVASGTLSGTSVSLTGLSSYTELVLQVNSINTGGTNNNKYLFGLNGNTGATNYKQGGSVFLVGTTYTWYYDAMSAFFGNYQATAGRINSNNIFLIKFTNCKNPGFTDMDMISFYTTGGSVQAYEYSKGVYTVSEAVSSIEIKNDVAQSFTQGSYVLWGA